VLFSFLVLYFNWQNEQQSLPDFGYDVKIFSSFSIRINYIIEINSFLHHFLPNWPTDLSTTFENLVKIINNSKFPHYFTFEKSPGIPTKCHSMHTKLAKLHTKTQLAVSSVACHNFANEFMHFSLINQHFLDILYTLCSHTFSFAPFVNVSFF
jgi:hypothetical protein